MSPTLRYEDDVAGFEDGLVHQCAVQVGKLGEVWIDEVGLELGGVVIVGIEPRSCSPVLRRGEDPPQFSTRQQLHVEPGHVSVGMQRRSGALVANEDIRKVSNLGGTQQLGLAMDLPVVGVKVLGDPHPLDGGGTVVRHGRVVQVQVLPQGGILQPHHIPQGRYVQLGQVGRLQSRPLLPQQADVDEPHRVTVLVGDGLEVLLGIVPVVLASI
mmetsp:Transcript_4119/g.9352  ORF Transcript_4119/g.9352 Transcript_4119/m.9352 type:complete len:213 (-) Transcript_4119:959-1597(-)